MRQLPIIIPILILSLISITYGAEYTVTSFTINDSYVQYTGGGANWYKTGVDSWGVDTTNHIQCWSDTGSSNRTTWADNYFFCFDHETGIINISGNKHTSLLQWRGLTDENYDLAYPYREVWNDDITVDTSSNTSYLIAGLYKDYIFWEISVNQSYNGSHYNIDNLKWISKADGSMKERYSPRCEIPDYSPLFGEFEQSSHCHIWLNNEVVLNQTFVGQLGVINYIQFEANTTLDCDNNEIIVNDVILQESGQWADDLTIKNCNFINNDTDYNFFLMANIMTPNPSLSIINCSQNDDVAFGDSSTLDWTQVNYESPYSEVTPTNENLVFTGNDGISLTHWSANNFLLENNSFGNWANSDASISNAVIKNNIVSGIMEFGSIYDSIIEDNTFEDIDQDDIKMYYTENLTVRWNSFNQADLSFPGNDPNFNRDIAIYENTFTDCQLYLSYVHNATVTNNNFTNPIQGTPLYWGGPNENITFSYNRFVNIGNQTCLGDCDADPEVWNATTYDNMISIDFQQLENSLIEYNTFANVTGSVRFRNGVSDTTIRYNIFDNIYSITEIRNAGTGVIFEYNNVTAIEQYNFGYGAYGALDVRDVNGAIVRNNYFNGPFRLGIRARGSSVGSLINNNVLIINVSKTFFDMFVEDGYGGEYVGIIDALQNRDTASNTIFIDNNITVIAVDEIPGYSAIGSNGDNTLWKRNIFTGKNISDSVVNSKWQYNTFINCNILSSIGTWKCNTFVNTVKPIFATCGSVVTSSTSVITGGSVTSDQIVIAVDGLVTDNVTEHNTTEEVIITFDSTPTVSFDFNFGVDDLNTSDISISADSEEITVDNTTAIRDYIIVDLGTQATTKTMYIDDNGLYFVCVEDAIITDVSDISLDCNGTDEYDFTDCIGGTLTIGNITCNDLGGRLKFDGLTHSGILGLSEEVLATIRESCGNTKNTIFLAFGLLALVAIVASGFLLVKIFESGADIESMLAMTLVIIGLTIVLFIGYYVISAVSASICLV